MKQRLFFCNYWTTYRCNSRCGFCNIWRDPKLKDVPDAKFRDAERNLDDLKQLGVKAIDFTGGEPLLNHDLPQILSSAKDKGFFVKLATNGLLYPDKAEELKGLPSRVYISLDTISPEEYTRIRGVPGFDKVLESIKVAKDLHQDLCLFFTATDENLLMLPSVVRFAQKQKVTVYIHPCFSYFDNTPLSQTKVRELRKWFWQPYVRMNLPQLAFHQAGGNSTRHPSCLVGTSTIDIGPDNCLTSPCFHRALKRVPINGRLLEMYHAPKWEELYGQAGRYDFCEHCTIDCFFGLSYWDRVSRHFFAQNLTSLKDLIEARRIRHA
jgi:MoaA/NifB/PqqE/SkfB family radical SAM enzyme